MLAINFDSIIGDESISVVPDSDSRIAVGAFADSLSAKLETQPKIANKINIVFDEIYANIVNYSKATLATIFYSIENGKLRISFTDNGIPYNPLEAAEPDVALSAEEREIGGLGIFMVKKMTESMEYEYINDKNNNNAAAEMIFNAGILPKAAIAKKALVNLYGSIIYMDGSDMKTALQSFYNVINLAYPADDFYYEG
jgi:anti-sigma regulatory factor (Ser/Thr protein kinase)